MGFKKIVIVDDDTQNLTLLEEYLSERYSVYSFSEPLKAIEEINRIIPDIILLDIDMPQMNGLELCAEIRNDPITKDIPVIFLTVESSSLRIQKALELGANDYLTKPFRMKELLRRIEFRLGLVESSEPVHCGNLILEPSSGTAFVENGDEKRYLRLSRKAFCILYVLTKNEGQILSRDQLLNSTLKEDDISDRAVDLHIFRLRKALKGWNREIVSVYGGGYLIGPRGKKQN